MPKLLPQFVLTVQATVEIRKRRDVFNPPSPILSFTMSDDIELSPNITVRGANTLTFADGKQVWMPGI